MPRTPRADAEAALTRLLADTAPDAGDRLPPERVLAAQLGCSRQTLRHALAALEARGELWRHVGQGTFRGQPPPHRRPRDATLAAGATPLDVIAARLVVEPGVAAEAALRAGPQDVAHLRARVRAGRAAADRAEGERTDDAFHAAVATVAGNPVLIGLLNFLSEARRRAAWQREWDRVYRRLGLAAFRGAHSDHHAAIVDRIAAGDAAGAAAAMRAHLQVIEAALRGTAPPG